MGEINILVGGQRLQTHSKGSCQGVHCCIHSPSLHHMREWPQDWRSDRGLMERICPHGVGHPDPDDPKSQDKYEAVHGCDGCCDPRLSYEQDIIELQQNYEREDSDA